MTKSKYGHIRKRSNGTFRVYWQEYGDRKSQTFDTYNEAKKFLEIKKIKNHKGNQLINYEFFYYDVIVPTYNHISERTKYDYEKSWRILSKWIASKRIIDTDWQVVQHIMDKIKSPTQQLACFKFWRRMLNYAVLVNVIQHNPCNSLIKLKPIHHRTKYIYSKEELLTVLKKVNKTEFALPILLESVCGLRHEEYCGLDKKDIEIQDDYWTVISVNKAVTYAGTKKVVKEPKTNTSSRDVLLHPVFYEYLKANLNILSNHETVHDYINPSCLTKRWKKYANRSNIIHTPFANLRTVYATLSAEAGCIDSIVSRSMGHSGSTIKDRNYLLTSHNSLKINATILASYLKPEAFKNNKKFVNFGEIQNFYSLAKCFSLDI